MRLQERREVRSHRKNIFWRNDLEDTGHQKEKARRNSLETHAGIRVQLGTIEQRAFFIHRYSPC